MGWSAKQSTVSAALLRTHREIARDKHDDAARNAWMAVYGFGYMLHGLKVERGQLLHDSLHTLVLISLKAKHGFVPLCKTRPQTSECGT